MCDAWSMLLCEATVSLCCCNVVERLRESSAPFIRLAQYQMDSQLMCTFQSALRFSYAQVSSLLEGG